MSSSAPKMQRVSEVEPFAYPEALSSGGIAGTDCVDDQTAGDRTRQQQAEAFEQGRQSAQASFHAELVAALDQNRGSVTAALRSFAIERESYYRRVEEEVVQLALAVARKVLHREVQIDPQALAGIVSVTLGKLDRGTKVDLRVNPREVSDWRHYFSRQMEDDPGPEVHEDPSMPPGECRIETSLGSTDVGFESQLKEIETGLLDLLAERPGATVDSSPSP